MDLKIFQKAPIYTNFEGGARRKKLELLVEMFQKVHKNAFFFKTLPAAQKFWPKQGLFSALRGLKKFETISNKF